MLMMNIIWNIDSLMKQANYFKHLDHLEHEVYEATDGRNYGSDSSWTHVAKEYSKEFEECGYAKRLTRLKKVRNNK